MLRLTYIILFSFFIFNNVMYAQVFHIVKTSIDENMVYTMQDNNLQHYITTSIKYTNPLDFTSEKLSPQIKLTGGSGFSIGYVLNYNFKGKIDLTFGVTIGKENLNIKQKNLIVYNFETYQIDSNTYNVTYISERKIKDGIINFNYSFFKYSFLTLFNFKFNKSKSNKKFQIGVCIDFSYPPSMKGKLINVNVINYKTNYSNFYYRYRVIPNIILGYKLFESKNGRTMFNLHYKLALKPERKIETQVNINSQIYKSSFKPYINSFSFQFSYLLFKKVDYAK